MIRLLKFLEMPLTKLRWKRDHMPKSIVQVLFDGKYEREKKKIEKRKGETERE